MIVSHDPRFTRWRHRVFAATWLSYVGYYFCRQPFYVAKSSLEEAHGWDTQQLGVLGTYYLLAYMLGQFMAGTLGNRWGARLVLLGGMAVSAVANLVLGLSASFALFAGLMLLNGFAQATGWSANVGTMAAWFHRLERGKVMGWWATNFTIGSIAGKGLAGAALVHWGLGWSFGAGSLVLATVWFVCFLNQRNRPEDVGLRALPDSGSDEANATTSAVDEPAAWTREIKLNIALVGLFYFFSKLIRYALWSWAPYLLDTRFHLPKDEAAYYASIFDFAGITGIIVAGWLSDRLFHSRRAGISFLFVLAMIASCLFLYTLGSQSLRLFKISMALVGFSLFGPDALMTGAGAIDVAGSRRRAVLSAGIINGMGSLGPVVQELYLGKLLKSSGVGPVFGVLLGSSIMCAISLSVLLWRNRTGKADV